MIISRTPYRLSYFGGGSDYPEWFNEHGGAVLGCTINKYCFITYRKLPRFFEHKHRIVYSSVEHVNSIGEIKHSGVRECLKYLTPGFASDISKCGLEIHHDGDLPARSGTGSSSAFVIGLLNILYRHTHPGDPSPELLTNDSIFIERTVIGDAGGWQDQALIAHGGFNHISFSRDGIKVTSMLDKGEHLRNRVRDLVGRTLLVYTGATRDATAIAESYSTNRVDKKAETLRTMEIVGEAREAIEGAGDLGAALGRLMRESWRLKKARGTGVSSPQVDCLYDDAISLGCRGGKLIGAGGAGFMLLLVDPEDKVRIASKLVSKGYIDIPFGLEEAGPSIIYNNE